MQFNFAKKGVITLKHQAETTAVEYLGRTTISLVVCFTLCFLSVIGYNTYVKLQDKKIEVQTMNSNLLN